MSRELRSEDFKGFNLKNTLAYEAIDQGSKKIVVIHNLDTALTTFLIFKTGKQDQLRFSLSDAIDEYNQD